MFGTVFMVQMLVPVSEACLSTEQDTVHWRKGKEKYLYSVFYILCISQSTQAWITQFYLQIHHACLSFVSVHQMAPPLTRVEDIQLQLTTHLSTPKAWTATLLVYRTVYPHKWSPISYRSSAGHGKFAGQKTDILPLWYTTTLGNR